MGAIAPVAGCPGGGLSRPVAKREASAAGVQPESSRRGTGCECSSGQDRGEVVARGGDHGSFDQGRAVGVGAQSGLAHFRGVSRPELVYQRRLPGVRRRGLHVAESAEGYKAETAPPAAAEVLATLRPLAQLQQAVILAEAPDGSLYLIDQHRAHERVIYEHLRSKHVGLRSDEEDEWTDAHLLLEPVVIELKRSQAELFEQRLPMLRDLGLECERFGGRSFLIRSVPGGEGQEQLAGHLHELAEIAAEDSTDWEDHLLIGLSCRSALRRGRVLGPDEQTVVA